MKGYWHIDGRSQGGADSLGLNLKKMPQFYSEVESGNRNYTLA